jgi:hypothetical protein
VTVKVRDAGGVLRTVATLKVRGSDNVLRTVDFVRVRGPDNVLREVYTAAGSGGGTPSPNNPTSISPGYKSSGGKALNYSAYFTAMSSTTAPTVFAWSVIDGPGAVVSGAATNSAQLRISVERDGSETATFACDMTVGGTVYRATCSLSYSNNSGGVLQ